MSISRLPASGLPAPGLPAPGLPAHGLPAHGLPAPGILRLSQLHADLLDRINRFLQITDQYRYFRNLLKY